MARTMLMLLCLFSCVLTCNIVHPFAMPIDSRRIPYDTHAFAGQGDYSELRSPLLQEYKVPLSLLQTVYRKKGAEADVPQEAAVNNERDLPITSKRSKGLWPGELEPDSGQLTPQALDQLHQRRTTREGIA